MYTLKPMLLPLHVLRVSCPCSIFQMESATRCRDLYMATLAWEAGRLGAAFFRPFLVARGELLLQRSAAQNGPPRAWGTPVRAPSIATGTLCCDNEDDREGEDRWGTLTGSLECPTSPTGREPARDGQGMR